MYNYIGDKMNTKNSLVYGRAIFFLIVFVSFGLIIMNEKGGALFSTKIKEKINTYIEENYSDIKNSINQSNINYKNAEYKMKITSKENKNLYFYIIYKKGNINDTYKEDYLQGKSLINHLQNNLNKQIKEQTNEEYTVKIDKNLNDFNQKLKEIIINEDDLLSIKFYTLEKDIEINNWDYQTITNEIIKYINKNNKLNITPKSYKFTLINNKDITTSLIISNITNEFVNNPYSSQIIYSILTKQQSDILKQSNITYEYKKYQEHLLVFFNIIMYHQG